MWKPNSDTSVEFDPGEQGNLNFFVGKGAGKGQDTNTTYKTDGPDQLMGTELFDIGKKKLFQQGKLLKCLGPGA